MSDFKLEDDEDYSSGDEELQEAFAAGLLKPGLSTLIERQQKNHTNNIAELKSKTDEMKLKLPWLESLDLVTAVAPMAPDVALQIQETALRRKNIKENSKGRPTYDASEDPVLNEFKRENLIHRQAQAAVVEGIQRLKNLGISTKRPNDYFAEMAKTDEHMQKVRKNLLAKQAGQARAEKVRQLRDQKKFAKKVQIDAKLKQAAEKKEMMDKLKRVRKGKSTDLDFLEDKPQNKNANNKVDRKRAMKDKKFGFGGKKRGMKINTRESSNDMADFNSSSNKKKKFDYKAQAKKMNHKNMNKKNRPGKSKRKAGKR